MLRLKLNHVSKKGPQDLSMYINLNWGLERYNLSIDKTRADWTLQTYVCIMITVNVIA